MHTFVQEELCREGFLIQHVIETAQRDTGGCHSHGKHHGAAEGTVSRGQPLSGAAADCAGEVLPCAAALAVMQLSSMARGPL